MMRNVALGAVLGFFVMVLVLSIVGRDAPPKLPPPPPEPPDAGPPPPPVPPPRPAMMAVPSRSPLIRTMPFFKPPIVPAAPVDAGPGDAGT